ncbi:hypothetical protein LINPERHAP2_LOCUS42633, partial [Linum perenne]
MVANGSCSSTIVYEAAYFHLLMLLVDPEKKLSFGQCIKDGDLVFVYEKHDTMKVVKVC